jgi:hypothetical protein
LRADRTPELSVVVATDTFETIRELVAALQSQSAADRLELVAVAPSSERLALPADVQQGPLAVQVVEVGDEGLELIHRGRAAGVRAARAPVVVFGETHCFPEPGWAAALIETHNGTWTAVLPGFANANPTGTISWSNLVLDYGRWLAPGPGGEVADVPGHNCSFKRDALLTYGSGLEELIVQDSRLLDDLRARGHRFYFQPAARTRHLNVDRPVSWLVERLVTGRAYAGARAHDWSWPHRLLYAAGSPLIPAVRLRRALHDLRRAQLAGRLLPQLLPALCVGLAASALGELLGYAFGPSQRAVCRVAEIEVRRLDHVRGDRG